MRKTILTFMLCAPCVCAALDNVIVTLSYKQNGVSKQDTLVLGVDGKQTPDYDRTSDSYTVGQWEWSFGSSSGYDFRFGVSRGYTAYSIGRQAGMAAYIYKPTDGGNSRLNFGETYQLDISGDWGIRDSITNVFVSTTPFTGKKITNMTNGDITYGFYSGAVTIPKGSAMVFTAVVDRFAQSDWSSSWTVHSEQDWSTTFTPYPFQTLSYDFPHFANFIIYEPSVKPTIHGLAGALVYADMKDSSGTNLLHGVGGYPLYSAKDIIDSITVMTEWVFDQTYDSSPHAYINGVDVCSGHSTSHIIDYTIATSDNWTFDRSSNCYIIDFSMQLRSGASSSYSVDQRCWCGASSYADADADKRASESVTVGTISNFRASINRSTGEKKIILL